MRGKSTTVAISKRFQSRRNNIQERILLLCYAVKREFNYIKTPKGTVQNTNHHDLSLLFCLIRHVFIHVFLMNSVHKAFSVKVLALKEKEKKEEEEGAACFHT